MVVRGWAGAIATAAGAAAAASAAQLGLAYGMDIISWPAMVGSHADQAWTAGLTWAAWIAASATIAGAIITHRVAVPPRGLDGLRWHATLAVAAALGAAATVVLVAVPARVAEVGGVAQPQTAAAGHALTGVGVGLVLTLLAMRSRTVTVNLITTAGWLWALAVAAVVDGVMDGPGWTRVPLGFWDLPLSGPWLRSILLPDAALALLPALVIGLLTALPAVRRGEVTIGVATSGVAGPLLVAAAYLVAQPPLVDAVATDLSRQLVVPYLIGFGLAGSLLATLIRPGAADGHGQEPEIEPAEPVDGVDGDGTTRIPAPRADHDADDQPLDGTELTPAHSGADRD